MAGTKTSISPAVEWLVEMLDTRYRLPGTNIRFGLDALIGLMPGIGDFVGSMLGLVVVVEAFRLRLPLPVIGRMLLNLWIDGALGSIPILGDAWDLYFKAHRRNLRLLRAYS